MRVTLRDGDTLRAVRSVDLLVYLRTNGWSEARDEAGGRHRFSLWRKFDDSGNETELLVPAADLRDYALRISEVLQELERVEQRSQLAILTDLAQSSDDVIRIHSGGADAAEGSIPLESGRALVENASELMAAAALAAVEPRAFFASRRPNSVVDYLRGVRMGQTERGSFVVTVLSRVPPQLTDPQEQLFRDAVLDEIPETSPFQRSVTSTLSIALDRMQGAVAEAAARGDISLFRDAVAAGVSANLCDAVAGLAGDPARPSDVSIAMTWAPARPPTRTLTGRAAFSPDAVPILREAARLLKESAPREEFLLEGFAVKLERQNDRAPGTVTVSSFVDGRPRVIHVTLESDDYGRAIDAHRDTRLITCTGTLVKENRLFVLRNPHDFTVHLS